ncbi:hypothetical protein MY5147_001322 [Beauveria neobassiana]
MRHDGNLASPYESSSSSSAVGSHPQMYGDYLTINAPSAHRIVPSNAYPTPGSISTTPSRPHQTPGTTAAWPRPTFQTGPGGGGGGGGGITGSVAGSLPRDIKPKILPSSTAASQPTKGSVLQDSDRTKSSSSGGGGGNGNGNGNGGGSGGGDRSTTHNDVERKYRTNLKDRIAELRAAVPALQAQLQDGESDGGTSSSAPKVSKGTVLRQATEYIRQLEQANRAMMMEHQQLVERLHTLEAMLHHQNGAGGGDDDDDGRRHRHQHPEPQYTAHSHDGMAMFDPRGFS